MFTKENNKHKRFFFFSRLLTTSANNITTNECMHHTVIKTCIITETSDDLVHSYTSTSKNAKVNTIMSAKSTNDTLQLARVKGPMFTHDIHITFQRIVWRSTERVEKFADSSIFVYVYTYPVIALDDCVLHTNKPQGRVGRVSML